MRDNATKMAATIVKLTIVGAGSLTLLYCAVRVVRLAWQP